MGRPPSDNPLSERLYVRVDKKTRETLDECTAILGATRSEIIRRGINKVFDDLKK
ncbi:ribbon-helix-helix protein, CopG family [Harryflintia acetispora]|nr:ribbon-helix-helix protein, CopG family [Harryflintia acetispora]